MSRPRSVVLFVYPFAGYDRALLGGIGRYARHHGPWAFHVSGEYPGLPMPEPETVSVSRVEVEHARGVRSRMVLPDLAAQAIDGFIGRIHSLKLQDQLLELGVPVVALDKSAEQQEPSNPLAAAPHIHPDSLRVGRLGAEHFLDRGFTRFAFCGYAGRVWSEYRQTGFASRIAEAQFACHVYDPPRRAARQTWNRERAALRAWVAALPKPVAVMAANDIRGRQVLEVCQSLQAAVPDDVAVLGVDNDQLLCDLANPPLSSIVLGAEQGGYAAAELLDQMMTSGQIRREQQEILVEPIDVVARRSTDVIAVEDRHVATALRFIRENARFPIGVADVAAAAGVSPRTLQVRFQRVLDRPIREELQRARLGLARRLLLETELPIWKVAEAAGFNSVTYLERLFRRDHGLSLAKYRRRHRPG